MFLGSLALLISAQRPEIVLHWSDHGLSEKYTLMAPNTVTLQSSPPAGLALPVDLKAKVFGSFKLGTSTRWMAIDSSRRLWVDSNGDSSLRDEKPITSKYVGYGEGAKRVEFFSELVPMQISFGGKRKKATVMIGYSAPADASNKDAHESAFCMADYGYLGTINLSGKVYQCGLVDPGMNADFRGKAEGFSGSRLFIDVNGNGKLEARGEAFDVRKPFNIGGTTYELHVLDATGNAKLEVSSATVAEIALPADSAVGKVMPALGLETLDGNHIKFPDSFKGKLVLLDIWATWCKPCMQEMPGLVKAYRAYHDKGLELVSVTIDDAGMLEQVKAAMKKEDMPWPVVYEGKGVMSSAADLFAVRSIPFALLIDGDSGVIVANGQQLRGGALDKTLRAAIAKKLGDSGY